MDCLSVFTTGVSAFIVTNLDDLVILMLFFSQVDAFFRRRHIIGGQYLGFALLVLTSLPGFLGSLILPRSWIGVLGIVPIILGCSHLFEPDATDQQESPLQQSTQTNFLSPQTYSVAALTVVNGSDNIGVYAPLFANCTWVTLGVILTLFFCLVGVWCYAAYQLMRLPAIAETLMRYGNQFVPYGLVGLGAIILWDSHTLEDRGLMVIALSICVGYLLYFSRKVQPSEQENECS